MIHILKKENILVSVSNRHQAIENYLSENYNLLLFHIKYYLQKKLKICLLILKLF